MLAYYLHHFDPIIFRIYDNVGPRWYGLAYVLAFICSYVLLRALAAAVVGQRGSSTNGEPAFLRCHHETT